MMRVGDCLGRRCNSAHLHQKKIKMLKERENSEYKKFYFERCLKMGISNLYIMEHMRRYCTDFWNRLSSLFLMGVYLDSTGQLVDKWRIRG